MSAMDKVLEAAAILENSPVLVEWCAEVGLDSPSVIYPADDLNPEGESSAPWIVLNPESGSGGLEAEKLTGFIGLDIGIREKDPKTGVKQVWQLYAKVIDVLVKNNFPVCRADYDFDVSSRSPLRVVYSDIYFNETRAVGRENVL
ncbi:hypothetical protein [Maridesulfovibrio sp.]|uniref:hypothetical protein n=1 Tax=Maridesulfovibrio sp. TaxID=2795000 RepID=UPI0029CA4D34|nr:hypothetical protein [Maridesulfovibrio sp.]